jgi:hypothetical protein
MITMNVESSTTQAAKLYKKFKKIVVIIMVTRTEMILTQGYEILLNAFHLFGSSRCYGVPHSSDILKYGSFPGVKRPEHRFEHPPHLTPSLKKE